MKYDSWIAISSDGRSVNFAYKELSDGVAAISAKTGETTLMVFQRSVTAALTREQVEEIFERGQHPANEESFNFDAERTKVGAMTMAELLERCKDCAFSVKARPTCEAEWENWYRLGIAKEEWHRRQWDKGKTS